MYRIIRPLLFKMDAEKAHAFTLALLQILPEFCFKKPHALRPIKAMGLNFPHPLGLAAGLDKNGSHLDALAKLGFSYIELGTVTPRPQTGNPKPRIFRIPEAGALINRMGFSNLGVDVLVKNVQQSNYKGILGINIGKNKDTSLGAAAQDYLYCLTKVYNYASYITINISSPNTPDLRLLQQIDFLEDLLSQLCKEQQRLADKYHRFVPLVVKLSPDEAPETWKRLAQCCVEKGISGIIATNTSCERQAVKNFPNGQEEGGLSGRPLTQLSTNCLTFLKKIVGDDLSLIGVGGIDSSATALEKLNAGASLLQLYTGLIYQGPKLISNIVNKLSYG